MKDKNIFGNINVNMGNGNSVGDIGHKFYQSPPPGPNSFIQDDKVIGDFEGQPTISGNTLFFPIFYHSPEFKPKEIFYQGTLKLKFRGLQTIAHIGPNPRPGMTIVHGVTCEIIEE